MLLIGTRRRIVALLAVSAALAATAMLAFGGAASGSSAKATPKLVQVADDYFAPVKRTIKVSGQVKWQWTQTFNVHNVTLKKAPFGVNKANFRSQTSSSPTYTFTRKFTKPGKYHFICTIHPVQMQMDVTVQK